ncbi:MAG: hypothetical protein ACJ779_04745 [Chloroflexota bacterium]
MTESRDRTLDALLDDIAERFDVASSAVVVPDGRSGALGIAASVGLDDAAAAGLTAAIARPGHPIARTFEERVATFDVQPINPGGPALRSHIPLVVSRDGDESVVGVLALAHDRPIEPAARANLLETARVAADAIDQNETD